MICSMTGYGQGDKAENGSRVVIELSSLNNRFFETQIKLPRALYSLETKIKEQINSRIKRGKVICNLSWKSDAVAAEQLKLNESVAEMYIRVFEQLQSKFSLSKDISLSDLINLEGVLEPIEEKNDLEAIAKVVEGAVDLALDSLMEMRSQEGERLAADMRPRIAKIGESVRQVRSMSTEAVDLYRAKLEVRIKELLGELADPGERVAVEAAIVAEKCDVTEECVRIDSHLQQFLDTINGSGPVGKRLNFLLQELNREANTIGSKSISIGISKEVILLKEEIEKLREQVQNIE